MFMRMTITGLSDLENCMSDVVKSYNRDVSGFLRKEGTALKNRVKSSANKKLKKGPHRTGNYVGSITAQKPYKYYKQNEGTAKDSVKVYGKRGRKAKYNKKGQRINGGFHTHLIEEGHEKVLWGRRTAERVKAFYVYDDAEKKFKGRFEEDCENFTDKILAKMT